MYRFDGMTSQLNDAMYSLTMLKVEGVHGEEEKAKLAHKMAALERVQEIYLLIFNINMLTLYLLIFNINMLTFCYCLRAGEELAPRGQESPRRETGRVGEDSLGPQL